MSLPAGRQANPEYTPQLGKNIVFALVEFHIYDSRFTPVYARILASDNETLKTWWGIDTYIELSKDEQHFILVFVDKSDRKTTFLDEELNTWNGVLAEGTSAFDAPKTGVVKYRLN